VSFPFGKSPTQTRGCPRDQLQTVALTVKDTKLPKKNNKFYKVLDTFLFLSTIIVMLIAWMVIIFINDDSSE
jgi:hypothetical protein